MRAHTHIAEVEWLLVLRQPSYGGKTKRLVGILKEEQQVSLVTEQRGKYYIKKGLHS